MSPPRSEVWRNFIKENAKEARCKKSLSVIKFSGNTSNLWYHMQTKHGLTKASKSKLPQDPSALGDEDDPQIERASSASTSQIPSSAQSTCESASSFSVDPVPSTTTTRVSKKARVQSTSFTIEECIARASSYSELGDGAGRVNEALTFMISKHCMPLNTVEHEGFIHFVKQLNPRYKLPGRHKLTQMLNSKYETLREAVKTELAAAKTLCLTSDVWTDTHTTRSYLGITVHYLQQSEMTAVTVGVIPLDQSHTADYLAKTIRKTCDDWNIELTKVKLMVTDNGANIVAAANLLLGRAATLPCFAHTLNLVAQVALGVENVKKLLNQVKVIVTFFKQSVKASDELRRIQMQNGKSEGSVLKLIQEVPTRWNSSYDMVERFIHLSETVGRILLKCNGPPMLTWSEIEAVKEICRLLKPLADATADLSAEKYTTASKVIPTVHLMRRVISMSDTTGPAAAALKQKLIAELDKRFGSMELVETFAIATLLDPRFKRLYFQNPRAHADAVAAVTAKIKRICSMAAGSATETAPQPQPAASDDMWSLHDVMVAATPPQAPDTPGGVSVELRQFLNRPVVDRKSDPIVVWQTSLKNEYPNLCEVAMDYLSRISTSVPSERLFSKAGQIATQSRSRLTGKHLSQLIFLDSIELSKWTSL